MQTFEEFKREIIPSRKGIKGKVTNSWGCYAAYKMIRKHHWFNIGRPLKEGEFYAIIRKVNMLLADNIAKGETIVFPAKMGKLELRKFQSGVSIVNGKLKVTYPINWDETLKLWYKDEEAREAKSLVRFENSQNYKVKYCKWDASYENKSFYEFDLNRFVSKALRENIRNGVTDTLYGD